MRIHKKFGAPWKIYLKKAGADPTVAAKNGCTALDLALLIEDTDTDAIRLLAQETVSIAPPLMSFLPPSRPVSKLSRSISTPIFMPKHDKNWWDRFSSIFKKSKSKVYICILYCYIDYWCQLFYNKQFITFQPPTLNSESIYEILSQFFSSL